MSMRLVLLVATGVIIVGIVLQYERMLLPPLPLETPCVGAEENNTHCWERFYEEVVAQYGSVLALQDLEKRYDLGTAQWYCHDMLHVIGEGAFREFNSVARAYEFGRPFCRAGYYHGVLEGAFGEEGGDRLLENLDDICADIPGKERYSYQYYSCVHGIGHGLMAYFEHDLFKSLEACDRLSGAWEQGSCYGGVFMQNVIGHREETPSRFLKRDDLIYPCNAIDDRYREQCFGMQTSHMNRYLTFDEIYALCETVEEKHRSTCFQSVGRDISGFSQGDERVVIAFCTAAKSPEATLGCYVGASVDYVQLVDGERKARTLCAHAPEPAIQEKCTETLEWHIRAQ